MKYFYLLSTLFSHIGPASIPSIVLVPVIGELDVAAGVGGVADLLEPEAACRSHQISGHFSYQVLVSWGI